MKLRPTPPLSLAPRYDALRARGVALASQYGQTELGGMVLLGAPDAPRGLLRPVGVGVALRSDADGAAAGGAPREPGEGELVVRGCGAATPGYICLTPPVGPVRRAAFRALSDPPIR